MVEELESQFNDAVVPNAWTKRILDQIVERKAQRPPPRGWSNADLIGGRFRRRIVAIAGGRVLVLLYT